MVMEKPEVGAPNRQARAGVHNAATDPGPFTTEEPDEPQQITKAINSGSTRRDDCNEWWLVVLTTGRRGVKEYDVRVTEDTGTPVNWIHPDVVRNCNLGSLEEACSPRSFLDMHGKKFKCEKCIQITWYGRNKNSYEEAFFVSSPKAPIHMVLGDEFVTEHGRVKEICADRRMAEDARVFVATSLTEEEEQRMKEREIEHNKESAELKARSQQKKEKSSQKKGGDTKQQEKRKSSHRKKGSASQ